MEQVHINGVDKRNGQEGLRMMHGARRPDLW